MNYPRSESQVERRFVRLLTEWAFSVGIPLMCHKYEVPGKRGYPDRMVLAYPGITLFYEFKYPGERPREQQARVHQSLREMGFTVEVHDDAAEAYLSAKEHIRTAQPTGTRHAAGGNADRLPRIP